MMTEKAYQKRVAESANLFVKLKGVLSPDELEQLLDDTELLVLNDEIAYMEKLLMTLTSPVNPAVTNQAVYLKRVLHNKPATTIRKKLKTSGFLKSRVISNS